MKVSATMGADKGMYNGDRSVRKRWLIMVFVYRHPGQSSLRCEEFESHVHQIVYVSATPGDYENEQTETVIEQHSSNRASDPEVEVPVQLWDRLMTS